MNLSEYQQTMIQIWESNKTPDEELLFCCVGMAEESGEAIGKVKRFLRGEGFDREGYLKELGDVLAYLVMAADSRGIKLNDSLLKHTLRFKVFTPPDRLIKPTNDLIRATNMCLDCALTKLAMVSPFVTVLNQIEWCAANADTWGLEEVMELNLAKLADRKARNGTLRGSGDNR